MLFNTVQFLIFFVGVVLFLIIIRHKKTQHLILLSSSYFFFYFSSNYLIILLVISTLIDYYAGKEIWKTSSIRRKKIILSISLAGNLGLLGFYKYADFGISQINSLTTSLGFDAIPFLNLALPIGISFYTFQSISYTVDVYRGKLEPSYSLREFALFVSFFPQLVAGPIVRAKDFLPQLHEKLENFATTSLRQIIITNHNLKLGLTIMAFGFLKKMFFADNIAPMVNSIFDNPIGLDSFSIILGAIGFGIQIYGDFSGYSDIAIGAALILGFKLPLNFNKPYFAISPADFWRRWHISLSTWLRDYLYVPLGGNKKSHGRTYLNLLTVMLLGGLWHGAAVNFIIWGALHGVYLAIHRILSQVLPKPIHEFFSTRYGKIIGITITQYLVFLTWIPFRVSDYERMIYSMEKYVFLDVNMVQFLDTVSENKTSVLILLLFLLLHFISYRKGNLIQKINDLKLKYWAVILIIFISTILFFIDGQPEDFIYFKF